MQNKTLSNEMLIISKVIKLISLGHTLKSLGDCFVFFNESHPRLDSGAGEASGFVPFCFLQGFPSGSLSYLFAFHKT